MIIVWNLLRSRWEDGRIEVASDYREHQGFLIAVAGDKFVRLPQAVY